MKTLGDALQNAENLIGQAMGELSPVEPIRTTAPERSCVFAARILLERALAKIQKAGELRKENYWSQKSSFVLGGLGITKPAAGMIERKE